MNLFFNTKSSKISQIKRNNLPIWWSSEQWQFKSYVLVLFRKANSFNEDIQAKKIKFVGQSEVCEITTNLLVVLISHLFLFICTYFTHFGLTDKLDLFCSDIFIPRTCFTEKHKSIRFELPLLGTAQDR